MYYTDSDDKQKLPYIIHRTSMGCYERTLALLIEKYAGALPMWMSPVQVMLLPIGYSQHAYAEELKAELEKYGVRVECDERNEKIGFKIREAQLQKMPYMIIIGEKEAAEGNVAIRTRKGEDGGVMKKEDFIKKVLDEIARHDKNV